MFFQHIVDIRNNGGNLVYILQTHIHIFRNLAERHTRMIDDRLGVELGIGDEERLAVPVENPGRPPADMLDLARLPTDISARRGRPGEYDMVARSEEHTSELQSLMRISYAVFCL